MEEGDPLNFFLQALPAIISAITIGVLSWVAARVNQLMKEWEILRESQRNQLKAAIVDLYERAKERGYITPMELDTLNRMADSYFALGGNHYIHAVVKRANEELDINGEPIPY